MKISFPEETDVYEKVVPFGIPNHMGARLQLNPSFPVLLWRSSLQEYHDKQLVDFMAFGWPASYMGCKIPQLSPQNHMSSQKQPEAVKKFIYSKKK